MVTTFPAYILLKFPIIKAMTNELILTAGIIALLTFAPGCEDERDNATYYIRASSFVNKDILGMKFFKTQLLPLFNRGKSDLPGYSALSRKVEAMPEHSLLSEISQYVFGPNFDAVSMRVNNISSGKYYLFVDYGEINCETDNRNRMRDSVRLAVTVACKLKEFFGDLIEQLIISDNCLSYLTAIRNDMIRRERQVYWLKNISANHTLAPFMARELSSAGWTMLFNREGYDSFEAKKIP
jgi:hypothetical protein